MAKHDLASLGCEQYAAKLLFLVTLLRIMGLNTLTVETSEEKKMRFQKTALFAVRRATKITINGEHAFFWRFYAQVFCL